MFVRSREQFITHLRPGEIARETGLAEEDADSALRMLRQYRESNPRDRQIELELARTYYLMGHRTRPGMGPNSLPPVDPVLDFNGDQDSVENTQIDLALNQAIDLLEFQLAPTANWDPPLATDLDEVLPAEITSDPDAALRWHLLALCYREQASDRWSRRQPKDWRSQRRSILILQSLVEQFPASSIYHYDLVRALAEIDVFDRQLEKRATGKVITSSERSGRKRTCLGLTEGDAGTAFTPAPEKTHPWTPPP